MDTTLGKTLKDNQHISDLDDKMGDTLKCQICMEIMFQPVSLYPCLHNFCGGCFSDWKKRADDCPSCRTKVTEVKKNHMVFSLIDLYLKGHPSAKRPQDELDELDAINLFKQDRVIFKGKDTKTSGFASNGSASSSDEEVKALPKAKAKPVARGSVCRQCARAVDGYKCVQGSAHINCNTCNIPMPDRLPSQKCAICTRAFCNLYWKNSKCRAGVNTIDGYVNTTFTIIRKSALNENQYEQNVLMDYIRRKKLQMQVVAREMLDAMEIKQWNIDLSNSYVVGNSVQLNKTSYVCLECAGLLWDLLLYKYRETIVNDLEPNVRARQNCWYGKDCRTQKHNLIHAQKNNHICEAVTLT